MLAILKVGDLLACLAAFFITWSWAKVVYPAGDFNRQMAGATALSAILMVLPVYGRFGLYSPQRTKVFFREFSMLCRGVFAVWCLSYVAVSLLIPDRPSRVVMGLLLPTWILAGGITRAVGRSILREMRKRGWNLRHAAIIGTGRLGQTVYHTLKKNKWMGIEPNFFVHAGEHRSKLLRLPAVGPYSEIEEIVTTRNVDIVFLALPAREHEQMGDLLERLTQTGVDVRVVPDMLNYNLLRHQVELLGDMPVVSLTHTPLEGSTAILKRTLDIVASAVAIVALSPLMAVVALCVKLTSPGPIFYRQTRTSLGGAPFTIVKFRTMVVGAEAETGAIFSSGEDDPRLTRLGGFLRKWNLDELPQLWNVLIGHMSMVGPRPERPELVERFGRKIPRYMLRQHAKAGLTGWAQVNGLRGRTSLRKRVQYDLFYLCNWSLGFDLKILVMTLNPFRGKPVHWPVERNDHSLTGTPELPADVLLTGGGRRATTR
jgi:exopolysaccharide biosynthesis polyprenyl glycosylphosphotransferase